MNPTATRPTARRRLLLAAVVAGLFSQGPVPAESQTENWKDWIHPTAPGTFPFSKPFHATFRFGWANIEAAKAEASMTVNNGVAKVEISGKTTGAARVLWKLDAEHNARFRPEGFQPLGFTQIEKYRNRTLTTLCEFRPDGLWRLKTRTPKGGKSRWRHVLLKPIRDIVSAMFFVRSLPLNPGDKIGLLAYPGDSPFLVELKVLSRENIQIGSSMHKALKVEMRLQKVLLPKKQPPELQEHGKFRRGTFWLSDDAKRFPLRAEVDIFIGKVFAEIETLRFEEGPANF